MKLRKLIIATVFTMAFHGMLYAQTNNTEGVSISNSVSPPHPSAMLDVSSQSKGVSIPNIDVPLEYLDNEEPDGQGGTQYLVESPKDGLMIYNTKEDAANYAPKGLYFWDDVAGRWYHVGSDNIARISFSDMQDMKQYLSVSDVGMHVFVTTEVHQPGDYCYRYVRGLWYLSYYECKGSNVLEWRKVKSGKGYRSNHFTTDGNGNKTLNYCSMVQANCITPALTSTVSDSTLKTSRTPLDSSLSKLTQITPVQYQYNDTIMVGVNSNHYEIGVVAQEVEDVFPEAIIQDESGYKAVDYQKLTAPLIKAVQEQQDIIDGLEERIEQLENQ